MARQPKYVYAIFALAMLGLAVITFGMFQGAHLLRVHVIGPYEAEPYNQRALDAMTKSNWDAAITELNQAIELSPDNNWAYTLRGEAYARKGDLDKAIQDLNEGVRLGPKEPNSYHYRGMTYALRREWDKAIADYTQAVRLGEDDASIYFSRAAAYMANEKWDDAIRDFDKCVMLDSTIGSTFAYRAAVYSKKGDFGKAMDDLNEALRLDPNDIYAFATRCSTYFDHGDYAKALDDVREARSLAPDDPELLNEIAWCLAICPDASFRNGKEAVEDATKACELSKWKDARCIDTLAAAYAEASDFDQAVKYEKQALAMPDLTDKERAEGKDRQKLYEAHQPYRENPKLK